jgi:hypothetical protein
MPAPLQQTDVLETMESPSLEGRNNSAKALAESWQNAALGASPHRPRITNVALITLRNGLSYGQLGDSFSSSSQGRDRLHPVD